MKQTPSPKVTFLNPATCGIYKNGGVRFKTDPATGQRTTDPDNELFEAVDAFLDEKTHPSVFSVDQDEVFGKSILVPNYFDERYRAPIKSLLKKLDVKGVTVGALAKSKTVRIAGGHGSPGNDQRSGHIPYIKVSDIRALRMNINPTNMLSQKLAEKFWKGPSSGLNAWDIVTPNRASKNIGEFAMVLPGEEEVVLTKEIYVFRVLDTSIWDPFYLLWAMCLRAVREQWRRVVLMQTNREDCGSRHLEIELPSPPSKEWAQAVSKPFRDYFEQLAIARTAFGTALTSSGLEYIPSALGNDPEDIGDAD
jgi:type I restriction enzyme M protein